MGVEIPRTKEGNFKCPGCDYVSEEKGSVRLHYYWNHSEEGKAKRKKTKPNETCVHEWGLLNSADALEGEAIKQGYAKICRRCREIE